MIKIEELIDMQDKALESYSIEEITELLQKRYFMSNAALRHS